MNKLLIVDGNNIILRAMFAPISQELTRADGTPSWVLYRCMNTLFRHLKTFQPSHFLCVFDHGKSEYRTAIRPEYKANRVDDKESEEDHDARMENFLNELSVWRESMDDLFLVNISQKKIEADDIIATAVEGYPGQKLIISSDHDLLQLVSSDCRVYAPSQSKNSESKLYTEGKVWEKYGCAPTDLTKLWALTGDKGDNVLGINGVGPKTAIKKLNETGFDFETAVDLVAKTPEDKTRVMQNLDLINLHPELFSDLPDLNELELDYNMLRSDILDWARKWDFNSFIRRVDSLIP